MKVTARGIKITRKNKTALLVLFLFLHSSPLFSITYEEALELEEAGNTGEAVEAYRKLLETDEQNACVIVKRLAGLVTSVEERRALLARALSLCGEPETLHDMYVNLAGIEEILGNLESAQKYYQSASLALPKNKDFGSLLASAVLLFELGNYRGAEAQATVIKETCRVEKIVESAEVLLSRVFFATERDEKALQIAFSLMRKERLQPSALLWIIEISGIQEKDDLRTRARELLLSQYPDSPEAAIQNGKAGRVPSPSVFLGLTQRGGDETSSETQTAVISETLEESTAVSVQTGSYSVRENAEYALKDLEDEGFAAEIKERTIGEKIYYRVLLTGVLPETVERVILELKEKGFEGFRVYE